MRAVKYSLYAAPAIQAFLLRERDVMQHIQEFAEDRADPVVEVAGPPTAQDLVHARKHDHRAVPLPCVTLHMRKAKHHLTGNAVIEIACSDDHLVEVECWNMLARQKAQAAAAPQMMAN
jgi:hypothetical protein